MPRRPWKHLSSRLVAENPWWRYRLDEFELPDGRRGEYHVASTHGSVMIVPIEDDGSFVVVEQYRYLARRDSFEFPAGGIGEGESPLEAAVRELAEETGLEGQLEPLGVYCPWNGVTDELCHVFVARSLRPVADPVPADETEDLGIERWSRERLGDAIREGSLWDGMTLAAFAMVSVR